MTDKIKNLSDLTNRLPKGVAVEYKMPKGSVVGMGLVKKPDVAVQDALLEAGTDFPAHFHDGTEWLIIYHGRCIIRWGLDRNALDNEKECVKGDFVLLEPGMWHTAEMLEDTWMIGVTVPADKEGYPEGVLNVNGEGDITVR